MKKLKRKNSRAQRFFAEVKKHLDRLRRRNQEHFELTEEYWFLRGMYKSHKSIATSKLNVPSKIIGFDLKDRMRLIDQRLIELARELGIPNRYRDWKLD